MFIAKITKNDYENAPIYRLENVITMPLLNYNTGMTFGEEYYFYGNVQTDVQATIYEMKYLINLATSQYVRSSNPTWSDGNDLYFTEIGLYNSDKELMMISKLQSPEKRQGVQQIAVKYDF